MFKYIKQHPYTLSAILFALWAVINIIHAATADLSGAEASMWYAAKNLDWGYVELSPLAALMTWLGVGLDGNTPLAVRLIFTLSEPLALWLFYRVASQGRASIGSAVTYFLIAFSLPLLQIYGLFASSQITFFLAVAICLWAVNRYEKKANWANIALLSVALALLLTASATGVFLIIALIAAHPKRLLSWRSYAIVLLTALLLWPLIVWQAQNSWPVMESFLNPIEQEPGLGVAKVAWSIFMWFNPLILVPFLAVLFVKGQKNAKTSSPMEHTMRVVFWVYVGVMLLASWRGAKNGLWITPICFSMLYVLSVRAKFSLGLARYLRTVGLVTTIVFLGFRAMLFAEPAMAEPLGVIHTEPLSRAAADTLAAHQVERLALKDDKRNAALMNFYTKTHTLSLPSIYGEPNQYHKHTTNNDLSGRRVAIEVSDSAKNAVPKDSLNMIFLPLELGAPRRTAYVTIQDNYAPTEAITIQVETLPRKVLTGSRIGLLLRIYNPYSFAVDFGQKQLHKVVACFREKPLGKVSIINLPIKAQRVEPLSSIVIATTAQMPIVTTGSYWLGFSLYRDPFAPCFNSKIFTIDIINPKSKF